MKHVLVAMMLCLSIVSANAGNVTNTTVQQSWLQNLTEFLTGTQAPVTVPVVVPVRTQHHFHKTKHRHSHVNSYHKKSASVVDTKSHVHISKEKLFEEYEEWRLFKIQHEMKENLHSYNPGSLK